MEYSNEIIVIHVIPKQIMNIFFQISIITEFLVKNVIIFLLEKNLFDVLVLEFLGTINTIS